MNRTVFACASAAALALMCVSASAGDLKGFGSAQCSQLTDVWNAANPSERDTMIMAIGQWTFGYLSGRNAELQVSQRKELSALDNNKTATFIIEQCADFPSAFMYQIVDVIFEAAPVMSPGA